jgi:hypothetical protein
LLSGEGAFYSINGKKMDDYLFKENPACVTEGEIKIYTD